MSSTFPISPSSPVPVDGTDMVLTTRQLNLNPFENEKMLILEDLNAFQHDEGFEKRPEHSPSHGLFRQALAESSSGATGDDSEDGADEDGRRMKPRPTPTDQDIETLLRKVQSDAEQHNFDASNMCWADVWTIITTVVKDPNGFSNKNVTDAVRLLLNLYERFDNKSDSKAQDLLYAALAYVSKEKRDYDCALMDDLMHSAVTAVECFDVHPQRKDFYLSCAAHCVRFLMVQNYALKRDIFFKLSELLDVSDKNRHLTHTATNLAYIASNEKIIATEEGSAAAISVLNKYVNYLAEKNVPIPSDLKVGLCRMLAYPKFNDKIRDATYAAPRLSETSQPTTRPTTGARLSAQSSEDIGLELVSPGTEAFLNETAEQEEVWRDRLGAPRGLFISQNLLNAFNAAAKTVLGPLAEIERVQNLKEQAQELTTADMSMNVKIVTAPLHWQIKAEDDTVFTPNLSISASAHGASSKTLYESVMACQQQLKEELNAAFTTPPELIKLMGVSGQVSEVVQLAVGQRAKSERYAAISRYHMAMFDAFKTFAEARATDKN